jgi:beta-N-acetylhexosaminidase
VIAAALVGPLLMSCAAPVAADGPRPADLPADSSSPPSSTSGSSPPRASGSVTTTVPAATSSVSPTPPAGRAASCAQRTLATLSTRERAAQVLLVGVSATRPADGAALVRLGVGGVFLRGRVAGSSGLRRSLAALQAQARRVAAPALFVAVDQEGGAVQTVRGGTIPPFPTARVQGTWSSRTLRLRTLAWARELRRLGVNLDLAPVADVVPASLGVRNPPIGRYGREYGSTPAAVSPAVATVTAALQAAKVGATVKHFPGLGRVLVNTDTGRGARDPATTATDPSLRPFVAGIRAGAVAVMVSSASYPRLDRSHLAMWSRAIVTGLLRGRLGWRGLVVSDDLGQAAAARSVPAARRATRFVDAGGDLVLTVVPSQAPVMRDAIVAAATGNRAFRARLADAVTHVLTAKQTLGLLTCR